MFYIILIAVNIIVVCSLHTLTRKLVLKVIILNHQINILKRTLSSRPKRLKFSLLSRLFFILIYRVFPFLHSSFTIIRPETILSWYRSLLKSFWTFPSKRKPGRPPTPTWIKNLILRIKNENLLWGNKRIMGELLKLGIDLNKKTIASIIRDFRRKGRIRSGLTWKKFISAHIQSLFACDFFTVDTIFNKRFYVFFIIHLGTRRIVHSSITQHPSREFVRQRIISLSETRKEKTFLIHDRAPELCLNYKAYDITGIATSAKAPNMNAFAERFVRSVRRDALDNFIIFSESQLRNIVNRYIDYYNSLRPHQGIGQNTPDGYVPLTKGTVAAVPILSGLHHHYFRIPA